MSAPGPDPVALARDPECGRCAFHPHACSFHMEDALRREHGVRTDLERQIAVLTFALGELSGKGGAA